MEQAQETRQETKIGWVMGGWVFLAFAVVGLALPIIPQVPFAIAAAYCFSKGSPKLHKWILDHKVLGPPVKDWENHRVLRPKLKAISSVALLVGAGLSVYVLREHALWMRITTPAIMIACLVFVLTRKSHP